MTERFNLAEMLEEIEEMEKIQVAGDRVRVSQDDILKMLSMRVDGTSDGGLDDGDDAALEEGPKKKVKKPPKGKQVKATKGS